jgi:hypothetical protein
MKAALETVLNKIEVWQRAVEESDGRRSSWNDEHA